MRWSSTHTFVQIAVMSSHIYTWDGGWVERDGRGGSGDAGAEVGAAARIAPSQREVVEEVVRLRSMHFVMRPLLPQRVLFLHRAQHRRRVDAAGALAARRQPVGRSASGSDSGGGARGLCGSRRRGIGGGVAREARAHDPVAAQLQDCSGAI